jgi:hypothetical protein
MADAVEQQEHDLEGARARLGRLLGELSKRRHELTDVRLQLRRHFKAIAVTAGGLVAATASLIVIRLRRRALRRQLPARARRLRAAFGRVVAHPERVGRESPGLGGAVLRAGLTAAAAALRQAPRQRTVPPRRPQLSSAPQSAS